MSERSTEEVRLVEVMSPAIGDACTLDELRAYAARILAAGWRPTDECEACHGSGLYPNPTGYFAAPTEWLGCPDCMGAGRLMSTIRSAAPSKEDR